MHVVMRNSLMDLVDEHTKVRMSSEKALLHQTHKKLNMELNKPLEMKIKIKEREQCQDSDMF